MDKGDVVRNAATSAVKAILKLFPPESTRVLFRTLESILENGKWRSKVGVLEAFKPFVSSARDFVAAELGNTLPKVEAAMHDTKQEVRRICTYDGAQVLNLDHDRSHPLQSNVPQISVRLSPTPTSFLTSPSSSNACLIPIQCQHALKHYRAPHSLQKSLLQLLRSWFL